MSDIAQPRLLTRPRYRLQREQRLARPVDEVFAFFADAANLERLTPAFLHFRLPMWLSMNCLSDPWGCWPIG